MITTEDDNTLRIASEAPLHVSNVALVDPADGLVLLVGVVYL